MFCKRVYFLLIILFPTICVCQFNIKGSVLEYNAKGKQIFLSNVNVYWLNTNIGTTTDENGKFSIPYNKEQKNIVISFVGYKTDTITVNRPNLGKIWLHPDIELDEVIVKKKVDPLQKSLFDVQNVVNVDSREMLKAACCNLSESFETNPSVDVNISDAVTGAKQIQMLGLNSPYLLFTQENMPSIRGASQIYGLSFIPGSWIESIQITKGAGSVLNGFESISGQINSELVKPLTDKNFFFNIYANNYERYEINARYNHKISEKLGTGIYLHSNLRTGEIDKNSDGFLDIPLTKQINFMNRWQYMDLEKGWVSFLNFQYLSDKKQTGETKFKPRIDRNTNNAWGSEVETNRLDVSNKIGYVFPEKPYQSFGFQASFSNYDQNSYYGYTIYDVQHKSFYSNFIFSSIIGNTKQKFRTGMSTTYDSFNELVNTNTYNRTDNSYGVFFEYSYDDLENLSLVAGVRLDHHNKLKTFLTPRLHLRYTLWDKASLRTSMGRGKRGANIFAENQQMFASSRQIEVLGNNGPLYGLNPEIAWNYGISFIQKLYLWNRTMNFSIDFYRTDFTDQVIVDWEDPQRVLFYNLEGKSFSNSIQFDLNYEVVQNLSLRATYKNYNVQTKYTDKLLKKPLQPKHRFFVNLNYETEKKYEGRHWRFDYTLNCLGEQRIPNTSSNPQTYQLEKYSPAYSISNTQITRVFSNKFEVYLGGENLTNYTQSKPIIGANDPFGQFFDSTILYAPVLGGTYYTGLRYKF